MLGSLAPDCVDLQPGRPNKQLLAEKNAEIRARTQERLARSGMETLRKLTASVPSSSSSSSLSPMSRGGLQGTALPEDDDAAYLELSEEVKLRTSQRDSEMSSLKSNAAKHQGARLQIGSVFTQESLVESQLPLPAWKRPHHTWQESLRRGGVEKTEDPLAPLPTMSSASPNRLRGTGASKSTRLEEERQMFLARLTVAAESEGLKAAPSLLHSTANASANASAADGRALTSESLQSHLSADDQARYFGQEARQRYYDTFHELDRQRKIIHYKFDSQGMLLDSLYHHTNADAQENALCLSLEELRRRGVINGSPDVSPRDDEAAADGFSLGDGDGSEESSLGGRRRRRRKMQRPHGMAFTTTAKPNGQPMSAASSVASSVAGSRRHQGKLRPSSINPATPGAGAEAAGDDDEASLVSSIGGDDEASVASLDADEGLGPPDRGAQVGQGEGGDDAAAEDWTEAADRAASQSSLTAATLVPLLSSQRLYDSNSGDDPAEAAAATTSSTYSFSTYRPASPRAIFLSRLIEKDLPPSAVALLRGRISPCLSLAHMSIGADIALLLAECLHRVPFVESLSLAGNALSDATMATVVDLVVPGSLVQELDLSGNKAGARTVKELALVLANFDEEASAAGKLSALNLGDCGVDHRGLALLLESLASGSATLRSLDLSNNSFQMAASSSSSSSSSNSSTSGASKDPVSSLAALLALKPAPATATANQRTTEKQAQALGLTKEKPEKYGSSCPLEVLRLRWCGLKGPGAELALRAVSSAPRLHEIDLSMNPLGDGAARALAASIATAPLLKTVRLSDCGITGPACLALCVAARSSVTQTVELLELDGNPLGKQGMAAVAHVLLHSRPRIAGQQPLHISAKRCTLLDTKGTSSGSGGAFDVLRLSRDPEGEWTLDLGDIVDWACAAVVADAAAARPTGLLSLGVQRLGGAGVEGQHVVTRIARLWPGPSSSTGVGPASSPASPALPEVLSAASFNLQRSLVGAFAAPHTRALSALTSDPPPPTPNFVALGRLLAECRSRANASGLIEASDLRDALVSPTLRLDPTPSAAWVEGLVQECSTTVGPCVEGSASMSSIGLSPEMAVLAVWGRVLDGATGVVWGSSEDPQDADCGGSWVSHHFPFPPAFDGQPCPVKVVVSPFVDGSAGSASDHSRNSAMPPPQIGMWMTALASAFTDHSLVLPELIALLPPCLSLAAASLIFTQTRLHMPDPVPLLNVLLPLCLRRGGDREGPGGAASLLRLTANHSGEAQLLLGTKFQSSCLAASASGSGFGPLLWASVGLPSGYYALDLSLCEHRRVLGWLLARGTASGTASGTGTGADTGAGAVWSNACWNGHSIESAKELHELLVAMRGDSVTGEVPEQVPHGGGRSAGGKRAATPAPKGKDAAPTGTDGPPRPLSLAELGLDVASLKGVPRAGRFEFDFFEGAGAASGSGSGSGAGAGAGSGAAFPQGMMGWPSTPLLSDEQAVELADAANTVRSHRQWTLLRALRGAAGASSGIGVGDTGGGRSLHSSGHVGAGSHALSTADPSVSVSVSAALEDHAPAPAPVPSAHGSTMSSPALTARGLGLGLGDVDVEGDGGSHSAKGSCVDLAQRMAALAMTHDKLEELQAWLEQWRKGGEGRGHQEPRLVQAHSRPATRASAKGELKILLRRCANLMNSDAEISGKSDPYIRLWTGENEESRVYAQSRRIDNDLNPEFNEKHSLPWDGSSRLFFQVWDDDVHKSDESLGELAIPLTGFDFSKGNILKLVDEPLQSCSTGTISVDISFNSAAAIAAAWALAKGELKILLKRCKKLMNRDADISGKSDPFIRLWTGENEESRVYAESRRIDNDLNPEFNEQHILPWDGSSRLFFQVWDDDFHKADDSLGELAIPLTSFDFSKGDVLKLVDEPLQSCSTGTISVEISFHPTAPPVEDPDSEVVIEPWRAVHRAHCAQFATELSQRRVRRLQGFADVSKLLVLGAGVTTSAATNASTNASAASMTRHNSNSGTGGSINANDRQTLLSNLAARGIDPADVAQRSAQLAAAAVVQVAVAGHARGALLSAAHVALLLDTLAPQSPRPATADQQQQQQQPGQEPPQRHAGPGSVVHGTDRVDLAVQLLPLCVDPRGALALLGRWPGSGALLDEREWAALTARCALAEPL